MSMQAMDYLRLIGLTECLLGALLVALLFLVQRMRKRVEHMSMLLLTIVPEEKIEAKLRELARRAEEAAERRGKE